MYVIYAIARFFPAYAVGIMVIAIQLGFYFRRRKSRKQHWFWATTVVSFVLMICWFVYRGDLYSDQWIRTLTGGLSP